MKCTFCGRRLDPGVDYCEGCGEPVPTRSATPQPTTPQEGNAPGGQADAAPPPPTAARAAGPAPSAPEPSAPASRQPADPPVTRAADGSPAPVRAGVPAGPGDLHGWDRRAGALLEQAGAVARELPWYERPPKADLAVLVSYHPDEPQRELLVERASLGMAHHVSLLLSDTHLLLGTATPSAILTQALAALPDDVRKPPGVPNPVIVVPRDSIASVAFMARRGAQLHRSDGRVHELRHRGFAASRVLAALASRSSMSAWRESVALGGEASTRAHPGAPTPTRPVGAAQEDPGMDAVARALVASLPAGEQTQHRGVLRASRDGAYPEPSAALVVTQWHVAIGPLDHGFLVRQPQAQWRRGSALVIPRTAFVRVVLTSGGTTLVLAPPGSREGDVVYVTLMMVPEGRATASILEWVANSARDHRAGRAAPDARPPAGWHPDPTGAARLRWWDGSRWTEHVHN